MYYYCKDLQPGENQKAKSLGAMMAAKDREDEFL